MMNLIFNATFKTFQHQWQMNSGKCGVCGDPVDLSPRQNEVGGKFANGIISRYYSTNDTFINIIVEVKKNMRGYFEFRLCPEVSESVPVTHACLDKYQLEVAGHGKQFEAMHEGMNHLQIRLPTGVACERCVLQWKWHTGILQFISYIYGGFYQKVVEFKAMVTITTS